MSIELTTFLIFAVSVCGLAVIILVLSDKLEKAESLKKQYEKWWLDDEKELEEYKNIFISIRDKMPF